MAACAGGTASGDVIMGFSEARSGGVVTLPAEGVPLSGQEEFGAFTVIEVTGVALSVPVGGVETFRDCPPTSQIVTVTAGGSVGVSGIPGTEEEENTEESRDPSHPQSE